MASSPPEAGARRRPPLGLAVEAAACWVAAALVPASAAGVVAVGSAALAGGAAVLAARSRRRRIPLVHAALVALAVAVVGAAIALAQPLRAPAGLPTGTPLRLTVRVSAVTEGYGSSVAGGLTLRATLHGTLTAVATPHGTVSAAAPVVLFTSRLDAAESAPGAVLGVTGALQPGAADDPVAYTATGYGVRLLQPPDPVQRAGAVLRAGLVRRAKTLPGEGAELLPGLAIGDTSLVDHRLDAAMKAASLSHLTAVSGANCAVVTAAAFALAALCRLPRTVRVVVALAALGGFVVLVTPQPSVLRSAVMATIVLAGLARGRPVGGLPALALAVLVLLVGDPTLARSAGFALSVLATAGLLVLTGPLARVFGRVLPERLALLVAVPLAAQVACEPVLVLLQPGVPLAGVAANLLAEPAAAPATVVGLLACLTLPIAPVLGGALTVLAWLPAAWIAAVADWGAAVPALPWASGSAGAILATAVLLAVGSAVLLRLPRALRLALAAVGVVAGAALAAAGTGTAVLATAALPPDWEIAACDVGQGDGLVLNGGGGHFMTVDTGRQPGPILACLARLGVRHIDLMVLTHWDADHVGAARSIAPRATEAFVGPSDGPAGDLLRHDIAAAGVRVVQPHRGETVDVGRLHVVVLWPPDPLGDIQPGNPASITIDVTGRLHSIFTGDLGEDAQNALLAAGPLPTYDVVKVAHHGSADQSPAFYAAVRAGVGLISVGAVNDYHHPTPRALDILRAVGTQPIRTDQSGMILVYRRPDGRVGVWTERPVTSAVWIPAR